MEVTMYLYEMVITFPKNFRVYLIDNGERIFFGVVGCLMRYMSADTLTRKVHIHVSETESLMANAYLEHR